MEDGATYVRSQRCETVTNVALFTESSGTIFCWVTVCENLRLFCILVLSSPSTNFIHFPVIKKNSCCLPYPKEIMFFLISTTYPMTLITPRAIQAKQKVKTRGTQEITQYFTLKVNYQENIRKTRGK